MQKKLEKQNVIENNHTSKNNKEEATLKDVAALAGVSQMTVSRAINTPHLLTHSTLSLVYRAIIETGYIAKHSAKSRKTTEVKKVVVFTPSLSNNVFSNVVSGISSVFDKNFVQTIVGNYHYEKSMLECQIPLFLCWNPNAIIIIGSVPEIYFPLIQKANIPVVELIEIVKNPLDCNVGISHYESGCAAAEYLLNMGYQKIAVISANAGLEPRTETRVSAFTQTLNIAGMQLHDRVALTGRSSIAAGKKGMREILSRGNPEVVFCTNDDLAFGAMLMAQEVGLRVPEDIGIMGFNGLELARECRPTLTTINVDRYRMGIQAANIILDRLSGNLPSGHVINMGFGIVSGESTRQIRTTSKT